MRDAVDKASRLIRSRGGTATGAMSSEGYTRSEEDKTRGSVSERIARLRQSLSGDKLSGMAGPSLGGLATTAKRAAEEAKDAFGAPDGYADLGGDRELRAEEKVERKLEKRNDRKARERARASKEETKEKEPAAASKHGSYVPMDDGLPPPAEEDRAARLRRRSSELLGRARRAVASAADKVLPAKEKPPADETACSGGGRVLASAYVDRAQLDQFDRSTFASSAGAVASQIAAATTLSGASAHAGGLWALKARYIATQKVIPKKLAAAKEAEVRAAQLADTLNEATDRCNALQAREALLAALLDQAQRLDGVAAGDASPKPPASPKASPPKA